MQIKAKDTKCTTSKELKGWLIDELLLQREGFKLRLVEKRTMSIPQRG